MTSTSYRTPSAPVWSPNYGPPAAPAPQYRLAYFLFILVNVALFMRPTEMFPQYLYAQTYQVLILACFLCAFGAVKKQLASQSLAAQPITVCVVGLVLAFVLSHVTRLAFDEALAAGTEFAKVALYYLLFVGLVTTPARLRQLLFWMAVCISVQALAAVLEWHGMVDLPAFVAMPDFLGIDPLRLHDVQIMRLCGSGIFHNPNEFCYPIGMATMVCLFFLSSPRTNFLFRVLCIPALGLLGYSLTLTHSRGGFLGLLIGALSFLFARFGWRKACLMAGALIPLLFVVFAGRQTDIDTDSGTGQQRIQLWNDSLVLFMRAPCFGIGTGQFYQTIGKVVHNTYLQSYSELGFFGGTLFLTAFCYALLALYRLGVRRDEVLDPELRRLGPYLMGLVGGFMGCMMTMSLSEMLPTYTVLGLVVSYVGLTRLRPPPLDLPRFNLGFVCRMALLSALTLVAFRFYVWHTFIAS